MKKKSRDRKSGNAGGISPWVEEEWEPTAPVSDSRLRFDYTAAIAGSSAAGGCATVPVASDSDSDDVMMDFMPKKRKISYVPSNKVITHINNTLECYSEDADSPKLELTLPVYLPDFETSLVRSTVQAPHPDADENYPDKTSVVEVTQLEVTRIEAINRALIKVHECDRAIMAGMMKFSKEIDGLKEQPNKDVSRYIANSNPVEMMRAICRNAVVREKLLGEVQGVTLAVRRRDNLVRLNIEDETVNELVARPLRVDKVESANLIGRVRFVPAEEQEEQ